MRVFLLRACFTLAGSCPPRHRAGFPRVRFINSLSVQPPSLVSARSHLQAALVRATCWTSSHRPPSQRRSTPSFSRAQGLLFLRELPWLTCKAASHARVCAKHVGACACVRANRERVGRMKSKSWRIEVHNHGCMKIPHVHAGVY